jgi:hypothetical protein
MGANVYAIALLAMKADDVSEVSLVNTGEYQKRVQWSAPYPNVNLQLSADFVTAECPEDAIETSLRNFYEKYPESDGYFGHFASWCKGWSFDDAIRLALEKIDSRYFVNQEENNTELEM